MMTKAYGVSQATTYFRNSPPRIVIDATANISGGKVYLDELLPRLVEALGGVKWIVYGEATPKLAAVLASERVEFHRVRFPDPTQSLFLTGLLRLLWREIILPIKLVFARPCVLFSTANYASPLCAALNIPVILGIHNIGPFHEPEWNRQRGKLRKLWQWLLHVLTIASARNAARCIAFSGYSKAVLSKNGACADSIVVIPHGVNPAWHVWEGKHSNTLLLISHYHTYKNIEVVINALPEVHAASQLPIKLLVQGVPFDIQYYERLIDLVGRLGLEQFVCLGKGVGSSDLATLYASSRCLIFPAIGENCPITLLEAMSAGIPIIGASCPPIPELCHDAVCCYDTFDIQRCAEAITSVYCDDSKAEQLSRAGQRRAAEFTWERCTRDTASVLRHALSHTEMESRQ